MSKSPCKSSSLFISLIFDSSHGARSVNVLSSSAASCKSSRALLSVFTSSQPLLSTSYLFSFFPLRASLITYSGDLLDRPAYIDNTLRIPRYLGFEQSKTVDLLLLLDIHLLFCFCQMLLWHRILNLQRVYCSFSYLL